MGSNNFKPYLLRALYDWSNDNFFTPYILVYVNDFTKVPNQYVVNNKIVLNISSVACKNLLIDNKFIRFYAKFSGIEQDISIPIGHVVSFYAKENGHGMNFEVEIYNGDESTKDNNTNSSKQITNTKNHLKIIKNNI